VERISARPSAKVRISDPREATAGQHEYTPEQFATLFRSDPGLANPGPADGTASADNSPVSGRKEGTG
jgi:hypothetical protein